MLHEAEQRVDIQVQGKPFTSYLYTDTIPDLKKTVLFPVYSADGVIITRGFPLQSRPGERTDHPHHIGCWLNYGDVNGLDFWNNSASIPEERRDEMGIIRHREITGLKSSKGIGSLDVTMDWLKPDSQIILEENTRFIFRASENLRIIDRITELTAVNEAVSFEDNKEGMFAIRVTRALEHPTTDPVVLTDAKGNKTDVPVMDNTGVTGNYMNSDSITGTDVWGKRAKWVNLSGIIDNKKVNVLMCDHPDNIGYPAYWHARGYGLFAVNPLGQKVFSDGKESLNFSLSKGQSVVFKYRVQIVSGDFIPGEMEAGWQDFVGQN
jgi:hypothetical protein